MYILTILLPSGATITLFADNIAIVVIAQCVVQVDINASEAVAKVKAWL